MTTLQALHEMLIKSKQSESTGPTKMLRMHAVCSKASADALAEALADVDLVALETTSGGVDLARKMLEGKEVPDLLFVELDASEASEVAQVEALADEGENLQVPVIATSEKSSIQTVRQLLHFGVADFVPQPITRADVLSAIEAALGRKHFRPSASRRRQGKVISVLTSSGGAGATTVAVQLAHELLHGPSKQKREVCIIDLDVQFGNVALHLDLEPKRTIRDIVRDPDKIDQSLFEAAETRHESGLSVVSAPRELVMLDALAPRTVVRILEIAAQCNDFVVVDLPGYWTNWTANVLELSQQVLLVTQMTVPAVRAARRRIDFIRAEGMDSAPLTVVANRDAERGLLGRKGLAKGEVEKALGRKIDFSVTSDFKIINEAQNRGVPVSEVKANAPIVKQLRRLAKLVIERCDARQAAAGSGDLRSRQEV